MSLRAQGDSAENQAVRLLTRKGHTIAARNYGRRGHGEIDIISKDGDTYVFTEVKQRTGIRYGSAAEAVTPLKQRRVIETAMLWLAQNGLDDVPIRFDVITVENEEMRHYESAFDATDMEF